MINDKGQDISFIGTSAPVVPQSFTFPFNASHICFNNDSAVVFRIALSTGILLSTSNGYQVTTGAEKFWQGLPSGSNTVQLLTTSSSTGGFALRLGAWG